MKNQKYFLNTALAVIFGLVLLAMVLIRTFAPVIILPKLDKVIGMLDYVDIVAGGHAGSLREDGTIEAEIQIITSATNEMGFNKLSAR